MDSEEPIRQALKSALTTAGYDQVVDQKISEIVTIMMAAALEANKTAADQYPYALFAGSHYYPAGGWEDLVAQFDSIEEAMSDKCVRRCEWWQIVDLRSGEVVEEN